MVNSEYPAALGVLFSTLYQEKFDDTKGIFRSRQSKKDKQCND
jgi:hypothetical protein